MTDRSILAAFAMAVAVAAVILGILGESPARAQSLVVDYESTVKVTCAAGGTNFTLTAGQSYTAFIAVEPVTYRIGTDGDGGTCAAALGKTVAVGDRDFIKAHRLTAPKSTGNISGCCKSTGGTGTIEFNRARVEAQE